MRWTALVLCLFALPALAGERLLIRKLDAGAGSPDSVEALERLLAAEVSSRARGLEVVTGEELIRLISLEEERQLADCDAGSCLEEIADALGARYVLFGDLTAVGSALLLNLQLFDSVELRAVSRASFRGDDLDAIREQVAAELDVLLAPVRAGPSLGAILSWSGTAGLGVAVGAGVTAGIFGLLHLADRGKQTQAEDPLAAGRAFEDAQRSAGIANALAWTTAGFAAVGGALLLTGLAVE